MTDKSYYTASTGTDNIPTVRTNLETGLGLARMGSWTSITNAASPYTLDDTTDYLDCDATSGAITANLKASPVEGDEFVVRKTDGSVNTVTVQGNGANIDGAASAALSSQYDRIRVSYNGTEWARID